MLLLEDYDLRRARWLVAGVDVWLNTPIYPLEASGTSGMKAGMNGVINLSVLDGWWGEAYEGDNGWAIKPAAQTLDQAQRNREESRALYEILQDQVIPAYYRRGNLGHSTEWIRMAKCSIASILPRYNAERMVAEYRSRFYLPAMRQHRHYAESGGDAGENDRRVESACARRVARRNVAAAGQSAVAADVRCEHASRSRRQAQRPRAAGHRGRAAAGATDSAARRRGNDERHSLAPDGSLDDTGEQRYVLDLAPDLCGRLDYRIRAYPFHERLAHRFELGLMLWC